MVYADDSNPGKAWHEHGLIITDEPLLLLFPHFEAGVFTAGLQNIK